MPGWSGALGSNLYKSYGLVTGASAGTILTGASLINTKSAYIPICQSLEFNASGIMACNGISTPGAGIAPDSYIDIAVGAAGSEIDIVRNMIVGGVRAEEAIYYNFDRLSIPAGSRISARYQTSSTGTTTDLIIIPYLDDISDVLTLGRVITYGLIPTTTSAAVIDPGGSANTLGGWTALVASTINPVHSMLIYHSNILNAALSAARFLIDIGVGAAGSERVVLTYPLITGSSSDMVLPRVFGPLHLNIPVGTRISARARCSINDATDRLFGMAIYCMD